MQAEVQAAAQTRHLLSGNEALARGIWEAGCNVAAAYPGTPSTEILENLARYPDMHAKWAVNEKTSLEVAIGASAAGSRAFCAMKHVGMNVASDAFMSQTLAGVHGGLVIAVADDVGLSSSQNEQDSRYWGRFAHLPILEPADSQEAYSMARRAFDLSERFSCPIIIRMTTRVCHVKSLVTAGEREEAPHKSFGATPSEWVLVPSVARQRLPIQLARDQALIAYADEDPDVEVDAGTDRRVGFIASGPAALHVRETFPEAPLLKLGFSHPLPMKTIRRFADQVERLVVVEETEPLVELELKAAGLAVHGKDLLPRIHELTPPILRRALADLLGEPAPEETEEDLKVFPRPPTMCVGCPHMSVFYCLSRLHPRLRISGDIGCYTLGAGHPWNAIDAVTCMGASLGMGLGMTLGRGPEDTKPVVAVIGDSTFLHMGMQGLLEIVYSQANVTVLLLDNRVTAMTGGQDHPGTGHDIYGKEAPEVDFARLCEAIGVRSQRIRTINPYRMPDLMKAIKEETDQNEPSVIITDKPCVLSREFMPTRPLMVLEDKCTGCANCLRTGCPAIVATRRETEISPSGKERERIWVRIETAACTGCDLCVTTCAPDALVPADPSIRPLL